MNTLRDVLEDCFAREGTDVYIEETQHKVLFRRNNKGDTIPYSTIYALYEDKIEQGAVFSVNDTKYLIIKEETAENTDYRKYQCMKCNATIKWMFGKNDLVVFDCYMKDISESLNSKDGAVTLSSGIELWLPLNDDSKRINSNTRFFAGSYHIANKVTDRNYLNGLCYLYAERDAVQLEDDAENGIAYRWIYEDKPDTYTIEIEKTNIEIEQEKTELLVVSVLKNDEVMETQPSVIWSVEDTSICSVDVDNNVLGVNVGTTNLVASYKANESDSCISDSIVIVVKEKPLVVGEVEIEPSSSPYRLLQRDTKVFQASISGVDNPQWDITLNTNGVPSQNYVSTIDNSVGTFTVKNNEYYGSKNLIYTIIETTSQKSATYEIELGKLF